jgi:predicted HD superfamily hydrolase involved in NAD metabolism
LIPKDILPELETLYQYKPNRLQHVLGVRDTAIELGKIHQVDIKKLEIAALLHDITKYYSMEQNVALIKKHFANYQEILQEFNESILHAYSAYVVAKEVYQIKDPDILNPIMHHTIGKPEMTIYEKIIFISDYIEPNRQYESCKKVRKIAFDNLDLAVYTAIDDSITHFEKFGGNVPKTAYQARTYYKALLEVQDEKN